MGMVLLHRGQYAHAIKHFMVALRTFKKGKFGSCGRYFYCELCNNCAIAYYENHDEESAKEWFDKALDAGCLHVDMRRYDALTQASVSSMEKC
jgi:tetratricopeptide (TPR) repeat protein